MVGFLFVPSLRTRLYFVGNSISLRARCRSLCRASSTAPAIQYSGWWTRPIRGYLS
jgi:hypothetical protein